jgi:hypothetical protein
MGVLQWFDESGPKPGLDDTTLGKGWNRQAAAAVLR